MQRQNVNGYYLSNIEDFDKALVIYRGTSKNNATNLSDLEIKVLKFIEQKPVTRKELMNYLKVSSTRVHDILHGKDGLGGMLAKVAHLNQIDNSKTTGGEGNDKITTRANIYEYSGPKLGFEIYDIVAKINRNEAEEEKSKYIKKLSEGTVTTITPLSPRCHLGEVTVKSITVDRINSNVTLKRDNVIQGNYGAQLGEYAPTPERVLQNKCISHSERQGDSCANLSSKTRLTNTIDKCHITGGSRVTVGDGSDNSSNAEFHSEAKLNVSGNPEVSGLEHTTGKIKEYLNKECHGNTIIKSLDVHINDFRKLYPEFNHESRKHLEYAFNKVLKSSPLLDKSQQKEDTLQKPAAEKKGIAILKKALQAEKMEATL